MEEAMIIMADRGMGIMVAIIDLTMATMVATIGDIMVDTVGDTMVETMAVDIGVEEAMAVDRGDSLI